MNLNEARKILGVSSEATPEEVKKTYRELTKKYHPDVNKESDATAKFQKINEAYQVISSGKSSDRVTEQPAWHPFGGNFHVQHEIYAEVINLSSVISFKESVLGCKKDIKYKRNIKCQSCNGLGSQTINNGCDKCGGRGKFVQQARGMVIVQDCPKCHGKVEIKSCESCSGKGTLETESSVNVTVPGGIQNNNILRLHGMGNFAGNFGPIEQYTDVYLKINVTPEPGLSIVDSNVISKLEISLLEAITGCDKTVNTILGFKDINIKPLSRNKDEVIIPNLGVAGRGNHLIILDVKYPTNVDKLINTLNKE